jgi:hypothetical protein
MDWSKLLSRGKLGKGGAAPQYYNAWTWNRTTSRQQMFGRALS